MTEYYKPTLGGSERQNPHGDEAKFIHYAKHVIECAKNLAPFQSPTFRAVTVAPSPEPNQPQKVTRIKLRIFEHDGREVTNRGERDAPEMLPPDDETPRWLAETNSGTYPSPMRRLR
jgi:hypothetical protein